MRPSMNVRVRLFAAVASVLVATQAMAQDAPPKRHSHRDAADSIAARLDKLEQVIREQQAEIRRLKRLVGAQTATQPVGTPQPDGGNAEVQQLQAQVDDLKRSQAAQYADIQDQQAKAVKVSVSNGRPTITGEDFSFSLRSLVQYDSAYYAEGRMPPGIDFSSGSNLRRARFGFEGTAFKDWSYQFIYDFGGSGIEGSTISSAYIQYNGLAPLHFRLGAFPPPESFEDSTSAADLLFLERSQPTDLGRSIAGSDGRNAFDVFAYDDNYFASLAYTGGLVGEAASFDEQEAVVGRVAYRFIASDSLNLAVGADSTYVFKLPDLTPGPNSPHAFRLRERPELNVDANGIRLVDTGIIDADNQWEWGVEAAGNYENFYGQGGYYGFGASRRDLGNPLNLPDPNFIGWYVQGSWILTGEVKKYKPESGAWGSPKPNDPFTLDAPGIGAWELAARYSVLDLNFREGIAGLVQPPDGIRGGEQKIWTAGVNWYPNQVIRFLLDYQHTDVSRLSATGGNLGGRIDAVSLRAQFSF